ncbi:hypothetical protein GCM10017673_02860 [Streptosporangium violaceochromogenes]|nr:hypothetical protein GCM10017673_02860 [Streptosporangium violaceochromogenes]
MRSRRWRAAAAGAFVLAGLCYGAWVPLQFLNPGAGHPWAYVSELAAVDQPWSWLARAADVLAGLACLAGVALTPCAGFGRAAVAGRFGLALFGGMTIADAALFPLDCASLSDPSCAAAEAAGRVSAAHRIHPLVSSLALAGAAAGLATLPVGAAWRRGRRPERGAVSGAGKGSARGAGHGAAYGPAAPAARTGAPARTPMTVITVTLMGAATLWTLALVVTGGPVGVAQRLQVGVVTLWLMLLGAALWRERPAPVPHRTHVLVEGAGAPPVLICAGMAGAWFHWDGVAAALSGDHTVIRFDRPGLGLSSGHLAPPTLRAEAARIAALAGPSPVIVVGHSAGGLHAEAFARLHPARVAGLVLADPSCERAPRPRGRLRAAAVRAVQRALPSWGRTSGAAVLARLSLPLAHRLVMGAHRRARGVYGRGRVLAAALAEWLAYPDMVADLADLRARHPLPDVPVLILSAGSADPCHRHLAGLLRARLVSLPGVGHEIQVERPEVIAWAVGALGGLRDGRPGTRPS